MSVVNDLMSLQVIGILLSRLGITHMRYNLMHFVLVVDVVIITFWNHG